MLRADLGGCKAYGHRNGLVGWAAAFCSHPRSSVSGGSTAERERGVSALAACPRAPSDPEAAA